MTQTGTGLETHPAQQEASKLQEGRDESGAANRGQWQTEPILKRQHTQIRQSGTLRCLQP